MTLFLKNKSDKKAISIRYGQGLNYKIQINPLKQELLPEQLRKNQKLLQSYLSMFEDLVIVQSDDAPKPVNGDDNNEATQTTTTKTEISKEETAQTDAQETSNNELPDDENKSVGTTNTEIEGDASESSESINSDTTTTVEDSSDKESDSTDAQESSEGTNDDSGASNDDQSEDNSEDNSSENNDSSNTGNDVEQYTEKELSKMNAEQIKELAKSLGIEVTEDSTKKALIPVILNKQGK